MNFDLFIEFILPSLIDDNRNIVFILNVLSKIFFHLQYQYWKSFRRIYFEKIGKVIDFDNFLRRFTNKYIKIILINFVVIK